MQGTAKLLAGLRRFRETFESCNTFLQFVPYGHALNRSSGDPLSTRVMRDRALCICEPHSFTDQLHICATE